MSQVCFVFHMISALEHNIGYEGAGIPNKLGFGTFSPAAVKVLKTRDTVPNMQSIHHPSLGLRDGEQVEKIKIMQQGVSDFGSPPIVLYCTILL